MSRLLSIAVCFLTLTSVALADEAAKPPAASPKFELHDGDRVVFLGNTLIERAQKYGYWETMLTARYPDRDITFRNLGWSGDTVWAESRGIFDPPAVGYQRMIEHVGRLKPTVIFVGYGNNEAFAGKEGLPAFIKQYNKLLDDLTAVSAEGVRFVLLSPIRHEELEPPLPDPASINLEIERYSIATRQIAQDRRHHFVDLFSTLIVPRSELIFGLTQSKSTNGIHLTEMSYWIAGEIIAEQLFHPDTDWFKQTKWFVSISAAGKVQKAVGTRVSQFKTGKGTIRFQAVDDLVAYDPATSGQDERQLQVRGLSSGEYELKIDGKSAGWTGIEPDTFRRQTTPTVFKAIEWAESASWNECPEFGQGKQLRHAIIDKNRLYFYRWRPQNITYLFGFRKHEQGQNAKELAEFDKLIAAKEAEINKLKKPVPHTYEIIRVKDKK